MKRLKLRNELNGKVRVLEANAGVYSTKVVLQAYQSYNLDLDPNATYREYVMIVLPDGTSLESFSSDEGLDYKEIVVKNDNGKVTWEGVYRPGTDRAQKHTNPPTATSESNPSTQIPSNEITGTAAAPAGHSSGFVSKFRIFFGFKL